MAASNKQGKMQNYLNHRMRVTLNDGRQMTGQMLTFDKHMNLVLADTEEFRKVKKRQAKGAAPGATGPGNAVVETEEKRTLGLIILRGTNIVSVSAEGGPPSEPSARLGAAPLTGVATLQSGVGISRPAGRGLPVGLGGPVAGVGAPAPPMGYGPPSGFGAGGPPPFGGPPGFAPPAGFGGPPGGLPPTGRGAAPGFRGR